MNPAGPDARRRRLEEVVAEVGVPVQRYLARRADPDTADDVLGEVLLVLWRRIDDVPDDARLAWSYGVARRCLANQVRGTQRQRQLVARLARTRPDQPPSPPDVDDHLHAALATLPAADAEVLRLWAWEELAPREIAVVLGTTANAVSIRLHRAKAKLRDELARKDPAWAGHLQQRQGRRTPDGR